MAIMIIKKKSQNIILTAKSKILIIIMNKYNAKQKPV